MFLLRLLASAHGPEEQVDQYLVHASNSPITGKTSAEQESSEKGEGRFWRKTEAVDKSKTHCEVYQ
jgi:hypothetical protein